MKLFSVLLAIIFALSYASAGAFDTCHAVFQVVVFDSSEGIPFESDEGKGQTYAASNRSFAEGVHFKGTDALRRENEQVHSIVRQLKLDREEQRILHDEITGRHYSRPQILEIARDLFNID